MRKRVFVILMVFSIFILNAKAEDRIGYLDSQIFINKMEIKKLNDNNYKTYVTIKSDDEISIKSDSDFNGVYVIYYISSSKGSIEYNGNSLNIGNNNYLHEFIKLDDYTKEIKMNYSSDVTIKEIFLFNDNVPDWVQIWDPPHDDADILLFSTHSDDEHLFFAGLIPTMIDNNKKIQVVYVTNHNDNPIRLDEQLNGLWKAGLRNYPILGIVPDAYSTTLDGAIKNLEKTNLTIDDVISFEVEIIQRFRPEVIVGHDVAGEYGHGQHQMNTYALKEALKYMLEETNNRDFFIPNKVYLHLYEDNPIIMNYDIPLKHFEGKTAYEVSKEAYKEHDSQQYTWFTKWLNGNKNEFTSATEIKTYSPLKFGLYYSSVGYENVDGDMFYNILENEEIIDNPKIEDTEIKDNEEDKSQEIKSVNNNYFYFSIIIVLILILIIDFMKRRKKH